MIFLFYRNNINSSIPCKKIPPPSVELFNSILRYNGPWRANCADKIFMVFGISSNYVLCTEELDKTRLEGEGGDERVDLSIVR